MNGMNHHPSENWLAAASASQITHRALREVIALLSGCGNPSFETP
jgi:mitochondrial fission protein ELM1